MLSQLPADYAWVLLLISLLVSLLRQRQSKMEMVLLKSAVKQLQQGHSREAMLLQSAVKQLQQDHSRETGLLQSAVKQLQDDHSRVVAHLRSAAVANGRVSGGRFLERLVKDMKKDPQFSLEQHECPSL